MNRNIRGEIHGTDRESNWPFAPTGIIYRVMRHWWPEAGSPSLHPAAGGSGMPPGVVKVK